MKGSKILNLVNPPALMAMYSESAEMRFTQKIVEKNTAIGKESGIKVSAIFPINFKVNHMEISRVTRSSVRRNNSKVRRKLIKKKALTNNGKIN